VTEAGGDGSGWRPHATVAINLRALWLVSIWGGRVSNVTIDARALCYKRIQCDEDTRNQSPHTSCDGSHVASAAHPFLPPAGSFTRGLLLRVPSGDPGRIARSQPRGVSQQTVTASPRGNGSASE
jgi:hypothetical protein